MKHLWTVVRRGWRSAESTGPRLVIASICALLVLSFVQLILTVAFVPHYVDWFIHDHGWRNRSDAPAGEVTGIYLGIVLRCVFSLFWVFSFGRLMELVTAHTVWSVRVVAIYGAIAFLGYGYWVVVGGPWYLTIPRALQMCCGAILLASCASAGCRRWLRTGYSPKNGRVESSASN